MKILIGFLTVGLLFAESPHRVPVGSSRERVLTHALWIQVIAKEGDTRVLSAEEKMQVRSEVEGILDEVGR
jgi:hypothetical protein